MGVIRHFSSSALQRVDTTPNPDPSKYTISSSHEVNGNLVLRLSYDECTNYEGKKILVFKGVSKIAYIIKTNNGKIDPHFCDNTDYMSPFARFEPTEDGYLAALKLCKLI